ATRVVTAPDDSIKSIYYIGDNSGYSKMIYEFTENGKNKEESIDMSLIDSVEIGTNVPLLIINTEYPMNEIQSKDKYVNMTLEIKGYGQYKDLPPTEGTIKGRGNSSWIQFPKKPYRLKFPEKVKICGLTKAKNYALLANYIDPTLLRNAIAFKIGEMLEIPYTNSSIPVNIIFNGINKGAYQLTEKIGFNKASLPFNDEEGVLFCLDQDNIDETYNASTPTYRVNYMVKDPDFVELAALPTATETADQMWARWKTDFETFERAIPSGKFTDYLDLESLVDYLFVYNLTGNREVNHPKSVYIYKENADEKYKVGPLWDFDWAYTFDGNYQEGAVGYGNVLFNNSRPGYSFFRGMIMNSRTQFMQMYREKWDAFKERLPELWAFIDEYAHTVKASAAQNGE
ncbi:MAG: CotH kinase family protein, partial [Coprobacter sp.]|nr:CotH kinase family protein [Coprobacter sp.]